MPKKHKNTKDQYAIAKGANTSLYLDKLLRNHSGSLRFGHSQGGWGGVYGASIPSRPGKNNPGYATAQAGGSHFIETLISL